MFIRNGFRWMTAGLATISATALLGCSSPDAVRIDTGSLLDGHGAGDAMFDGFEQLKVETFLHWRPDTGGQRVALAFQENFEHLVSDLADAAMIELPVCRDDCDGNTLVIQFKELGYDITSGENVSDSREIRGTLRFIDRDTHRVLAERRFAEVRSHQALFAGMHQEISDRALTLSQHHGSMAGTDGSRQELLAAAIEHLNRVAPVGVRYAGVLD